MNFEVIARSVPVANGDIISSDLQNDSKNISGLCANVCYTKGYDISTLPDRLNDYEKNVDRFERVAATGHHSIADHAYITVYMSGISKALAMLLNSLEWYTTSERSGRYTNFEDCCSEKEAVLYNKWKDIFNDLISKEYPTMGSRRVKKLALENARYMISVFVKGTAMAYTTSLRQWAYIAQWCDKLVSKEFVPDKDSFMVKLVPELKELSSHIKAVIGEDTVETLHDIKNREFEFFCEASEICKSYVGSNHYSVAKTMSIACVAQLQRHRTLHIKMETPSEVEPVWYVPHILKTEALREEWEQDLDSVKEEFPQALMVLTEESGLFKDFVLKCKERLCGRAQLEAMDITTYEAEELLLYKSLYPYVDELDELNEIRSVYVKDFGMTLKTKCQMLGGCNEPCEFAGKKCFERLI